MRGYSIFPQGILPTVVGIMVIWIKFSLPVHVHSLIPKMSMFPLVMLDLFDHVQFTLIHGPNIPGNTILTALDFIFTIRHLHRLNIILTKPFHSFWLLLLLSCVSHVTAWPHRWQPTRLPHPWDSPGKNIEWVAISFSNAWKWKVKVKLLSLSGTISNCSQLFLSRILHIFWPGGSSSNLLPLHTLHCILVARILKWFAVSSSSGPCFVKTLHYGLSILHSLA